MKIEAYKVCKHVEGYTTTETRYRILDDTGQVLDDAQGYGYRSKEKASAALWYKSGGRQQQRDKEQRAKQWLREYPTLKKSYSDLMELNLKELAIGDITEQEIFTDLENSLGVTIPSGVRWFLGRMTI